MTHIYNDINIFILWYPQWKFDFLFEKIVPWSVAQSGQNRRKHPINAHKTLHVL